MTERINGIPVDNGMFGTVDELDYHADKGSLSQSGAKILIGKGGPAKFREYIDGPRKIKRDWDFGHVAHHKVLGKGQQFAVLEPAVHGLTTKGTVSDKPRQTAMWKEAEAAARADGLVPIHVDDALIADRMAARVKEHPVAGPLFERGHAEVSFYETDPETGVRMRGRADWITLADLGYGERPIIVDYKTAVSADPSIWSRKAYEYGYYIQFPWYVRLYAAATHSEPPAFLFVVQEKTAPFLVSVIELDLDAYRLGAAAMAEALRIYKACTDSGVWPGYGEQIHRGSLPPWAFTGGPTINDLLQDDDE